MEKVWLSTTYYLDQKLVGMSAATERMFSRLLAYCGNAETEGEMPSNVHVLVGLPRGEKAVLDLVRRDVLEPIRVKSVSKVCTNGEENVPEYSPISHTFDNAEVVVGYRFAAWDDWQKEGNKLVQRKRNDRERKRRQREREAEMSRDASRDVTPTEKRREDNSGTNFSSSVTESNASELKNAASQIDPEPINERPSGPPVDANGWSLVRRVIPNDHPHAVRTALAVHAGALLKQGQPESDVVSALALWLTKTNLGPGVLPSLVSEVIKNRTAPQAGSGTHLSTADRRVADAQSLKSRFAGRELES